MLNRNVTRFWFSAEKKSDSTRKRVTPTTFWSVRIWQPSFSVHTAKNTLLFLVILHPAKQPCFGIIEHVRRCEVDQHLHTPLVQSVEQQSPKLRVGGSIPPWRATQALLTQLVEYQTFNLGVAGSTPAWRTTVTDHRRFNLKLSFYGYCTVAWCMYHLLSLSLFGEGRVIPHHTYSGSSVW